MRYVWTRVIVEEVVRMSRCRVIFFRVELTGFVDKMKPVTLLGFVCLFSSSRKT